MKKHLLFFLFMLLPMAASAQSVEIDGIYYYLSWDNTASVTGNPNQYSGSVVIPEKVTFENVEYFVTSIRSNAFSNCSGLTSITIPNSVTSIGNGAFSDCSGLTSITIPNSVISIEDDAFLGCSGLTSVTIGNSVTSIGNGAFSGCSGLTSITIPNSVTSIGNGAFSGCSGLTSITIPNSVTSIGESAFYNCSGLTSITIPSSVTSIGYSAFTACSSLTSVSVENGNTVYDSRDNCNAIIETATNTLLYGCNITIIPNSVTSIGGYAFYNCSGLTSVTIGNSVTSIEDNAFMGCFGLTSVTIPNSVTSIGGGAFGNCSGLTSVTIPNSVTSIGDGAFWDCSGLTSVTIPNSVTSIGSGAFWDCSGLTSISVENGNTVYDSRDNCNAIIETATNTLLYGCNNTIIPNNVTSIGEWAFQYCSGLTSITIPNSVTSIGDGAFDGWSGLTSITIGNSVTSIGSNAFWGCSGLKKVIVKDITAWCGIKFGGDDSNPLYYAKHIYSDEDTEITNLIIPNSVTSIGSYAFFGCSGLTSVTIPNSVTSIGESAFRECSGLTSVTIPNSVTSIGDYAFRYCSGLTSVTIPNSLTSIGSCMFYGCSGLTSITIPNSVTSIGNTAFSGCSGLTSVTIPNSVTSIGSSAFSGCSGLTSITIGSGIKNIYGSAFASCPDLTDVTCYAENVPNTRTDAFKDSYIEYATLHVPASAVNAYKAADPWKNFKSITAIGGDTPTTQKCEKPTISYENGKLTFTCETEGAVCQSTITDPDITSYSGNEVQLGVTYNISVFATKSGYDNSETATATLCWIDQQPKTEGITNGIANIPAQAVLIQSEGGSIKVQGVDEGTQVNVYSINGTQAGSAISQSGAATINTNLQPGSIAIVKIGQKSVKVVIK